MGSDEDCSGLKSEHTDHNGLVVKQFGFWTVSERRTILFGFQTFLLCLKSELYIGQMGHKCPKTKQNWFEKCFQMPKLVLFGFRTFFVPFTDNFCSV